MWVKYHFIDECKGWKIKMGRTVALEDLHFLLVIKKSYMYKLKKKLVSKLCNSYNNFNKQILHFNWLVSYYDCGKLNR